MGKAATAIIICSSSYTTTKSTVTVTLQDIGRHIRLSVNSGGVDNFSSEISGKLTKKQLSLLFSLGDRIASKFCIAIEKIY